MNDYSIVNSIKCLSIFFLIGNLSYCLEYVFVNASIIDEDTVKQKQVRHYLL